MFKKIKKLLFCEKYVDSVFKNCEAYDFSEGKAMFCADEKLLSLLFPKEHSEAKSKAEKEYLERMK